MRHSSARSVATFRCDRQPPQHGENVTKLVHIGQAVIDRGGSVDYFRDAVFNYPTLAEAYKVAALDGLNRIA
jgi:hypothetical protein